MPLLRHKANREEVIASMPLREFFVFWDDISDNEIALLQNILEMDTDEREMQSFLQEHPKLLIQHLGGGHGRWVIPQKKLGAEHVTDFVIGEAHSGGHEWQAVELESPKARLFTKKGDPSATLVHAIRQIQDWRSWIKYNQNYASRPKTEKGLELTDISCNVKGLIIIGRRSKVDAAIVCARYDAIPFSCSTSNNNALLNAIRGRKTTPDGHSTLSTPAKEHNAYMLASASILSNVPCFNNLTYREILRLRSYCADELTALRGYIKKLATSLPSTVDEQEKENLINDLVSREVTPLLIELERKVSLSREKWALKSINKAASLQTLGSFASTVIAGIPLHYGLMIAAGVAGVQTAIEQYFEKKELLSNSSVSLLLRLRRASRKKSSGTK